MNAYQSLHFKILLAGCIRQNGLFWRTQFSNFCVDLSDLLTYKILSTSLWPFFFLIGRSLVTPICQNGLVLGT